MSRKTRSRRIRWGLLSTARINRSVIPPIHSSKQSELIAVASRNQQRAIEYAKEWEIPKAYGSYEAMLADAEIDVIYVSLPNSLHSEWSIKAMNAGKHVLCEKPLCLSLSELDKLESTSQQTGKYTVEAFMYRHHPQTLMAKEVVTSGKLGELRFIRGSFSFNLNRQNDPRLDSSLGGGSIWDVGCYPINYMRWITGHEPEEVFGWQKNSSNGIDVSFFGQLRFPNQVFAQFDSSLEMPRRVFLEVVGAEGVMTIPDPFTPKEKSQIMLNIHGNTEIISFKRQDLYLGEVTDMENVILDDQNPRISLEDSRGNLTSIIALIESVKSEKPVILNYS